MLRLLEKVPGFYEESLSLVRNFKIKKLKVKNILFCGMGASGVVGDLVKDYLYDEIKVPIIVNKNDEIPEFVNKDTLVFIISYSGKSKETLKCYKKCKLKRAKIIGITANKNLKFKKRILVPDKLNSRVILNYSLFPVLIILSKLKLIKDKSKEINKAVRSIKVFNKDLRKIKEIANQLYKRIPVIYSNFTYRAVGYYWKTQLNEISKVFALQNFFPEVEHNEIEVNNSEDFEIINLKESKKNLSAIIYYMLSADYVAYYLAKANGISDPLKTPRIDRIRKRLSKNIKNPTKKPR